MRDSLLYLLIGAIITSALFFFISGEKGLISSISAYISASAVILASFSSYRQMVISRLNDNMIPEEDRDTLDKIEDPHRLYEDNQDSQKSPSEILKEEKIALKKSRRKLSELFKDSIPALSPLKILSYLLLAGLFIWLKDSGNMNLGVYLISLSFPILIVIFTLISKESKD